MNRSVLPGLVALLAAGLSSQALAVEREPLPAAQVEKALAALEAQAASSVADKSVPGIAIAVVHDDTVIFAKGFGVRDTATGEAVDADTVFQLASVSKAVGSTVISGLIGDGNLTWDTRLSDLTPSFEMSEPWVTHEVTIRDMYAHRSGLPDHAGDILEDMGYDRAEVLHRLRFQPPKTSFRSAYAYTNFGMTAAAVAAATVSGADWETVSEERLYKPLGMASTSSRYADFAAWPNRAAGHMLIDGKWVNKQQREPDAQSPAGGVSSSVNDLAKWMRLLIDDGKFDGKQVIAADPLVESHLPAMRLGPTLDGVPGYYGLGWNVNYSLDGRHRISHSGAFALGAGTNVNISLDDHLGIVVLTNGAPTGIAEGLAAEFLDNAIYGEQRHPWFKIYKDAFAQMASAETESDFDTPPANAAPAAPNEVYLGTYSNDTYGDIEVVAADGGLAMLQGPKKMSLPLAHFDRDVFTYVTVGESASGITGVSFALGGDGKAVTMWIEALDGAGQGTFKRKAD